MEIKSYWKAALLKATGQVTQATMQLPLKVTLVLPVEWSSWRPILINEKSSAITSIS